MSTHVLVGFDESRQAKAALRHALEKFPDAEITVIHVNNPQEWMAETDDELFYSDINYERVRESGRETLEEAESIAAEYDREIETAMVTGRPVGEIVGYAEDNDVDHILVGSHGRKGLNRFLLGSVAEKVVRRSPCPVTVIRGKGSE